MFLPAAVSARVLPAVSAASNMSAPPRGGGEGGGVTWKCVHCKAEIPKAILSFKYCPECGKPQNIPTGATPAVTQEPDSVKPDNTEPSTSKGPGNGASGLYPSLTDIILLDISSDSDSYTSPQGSPQRKRRSEDAEPRGGEKKRARSIDGTPSPHLPPPMETPQPIEPQHQIQPDLRDTAVERDHPSTLTRLPINSREPDIRIVKVERKTPPPQQPPPVQTPPVQPPPGQPPPVQPPPQTPPRATYPDKAALLLDPRTPQPVSCA